MNHSMAQGSNIPASLYQQGQYKRAGTLAQERTTRQIATPPEFHSFSSTGIDGKELESIIESFGYDLGSMDRDERQELLEFLQAKAARFVDAVTTGAAQFATARHSDWIDDNDVQEFVEQAYGISCKEQAEYQEIMSKQSKLLQKDVTPCLLSSKFSQPPAQITAEYREKLNLIQTLLEDSDRLPAATLAACATSEQSDLPVSTTSATNAE